MQPKGPREPFFGATPWTAVLIAGSILALYFLQSQVEESTPVVADLALIPARLAQGYWVGVFGHMLLHGSWVHALSNAGGALIFGTPVARAIGERGVQPLAFLLFYIVCGVLAGGLYGLLVLYAAAGGVPGFHPNPLEPMVGASGAISGLYGAASRLIEQPGRLGPVFSRTAVGMGAAFLVLNVFFAAFGFTPGSGGQAVAWQVHIIGYFAGLLLIGPWLAAVGHRFGPAAPAFERPGVEP